MNRFGRCILILSVLSILITTGCSWMGETAGRAKAGVENAINDTRNGYDKGYTEGKGGSV